MVNMKEDPLKNLQDRCTFLEQKLEESNGIIEKLCERDIVFSSLPYAASAFLEGNSLDEGLVNVMNRLERAYAVPGVFLVSLDAQNRSGVLLAASSSCGVGLPEDSFALTDSFPFQNLQDGFVSPLLAVKDVFSHPPGGLQGHKRVILIPSRGTLFFFGCLGVLQDENTRRWDEVETDTLKGIASLAGHAIEFDSLKRGIEEDRDQLEQIVEERTADLKNMNTALRAEANRRKKAQFALRNRHKILREMYNRVPVGAVIIRTDGSFDFSNHYFRFMTGYAKKELNELVIKDVLKSARGNCFTGSDDQFRSDIKDLGASLLHQTGKEVEVRISTFPLQNDTDKTGGTVCLFTDLSRQKEQEHRERLMKIQLTKLTLELDKLKSVVTGNMDKPKEMDIDTFGLTKREKETLLFALQGYRTREISRRMGVVEVTIRKNLTSIFRKLDVRDRYELIEKYRDLVYSRE